MGKKRFPLETRHAFYKRTLLGLPDKQLDRFARQWEEASYLTRLFYDCFYLSVDVLQRSWASRDLLVEREYQGLIVLVE